MTGPPIGPLDDLREQFRSAAHRQIGLEGATRRRRRRFAIGAAVGVAATGGVAVATQLISTGRPVREPAGKGQRYQRRDAGVLAVTAPDKAQALPWGVLNYTTRDGEACALAGAARGAELGHIEGGTFRPYAGRRGGACGDIAHVPFFLDLVHMGGRTLVYGRARADVAAMRVKVRGKTLRAPTGSGGAYLFVLSDRVELFELDVAGLDRGGNPVS